MIEFLALQVKMNNITMEEIPKAYKADVENELNKKNN